MALYGNMLTIPQKTSIADGSITTAKLVDGAVTGAKMATETILNANYAPASITKNKLANDVKYTSCVERDSSASMYITSAWGSYLNYVIGDNDITIDNNEFQALEPNWRADMISGNKDRHIGIIGITPIIDSESGIVYNSDCTKFFPKGSIFWIKKLSTGGALIGGSSFQISTSVVLGDNTSLALSHNNSELHMYGVNKTITLTKEIADIMPVGWHCRIQANNQFVLAWEEIGWMCNLEGHTFYNGAYSIVIPYGGYVDIKKFSSTEYTMTGNYTTDQYRHISYGTTEPTGGNDGDIYIQYVE